MNDAAMIIRLTNQGSMDHIVYIRLAKKEIMPKEPVDGQWKKCGSSKITYLSNCYTCTVTLLLFTTVIIVIITSSQIPWRLRIFKETAAACMSHKTKSAERKVD